MLNLMTRDGVEKDMMVPRGDLGKIIEDGFNTGQDLTITVISVGDEEAVVGCR
jgi:translation initiation factor 5A